MKKTFPIVFTRKKEKRFFAEISDTSRALEAVDPGEGFDAYVIQITEPGIRIDARDEHGLFYGLQTFFQLPEEIPCGMIRDYAAINSRMILWVLKGYQPRFEIMLEKLEILASYKVNAILLEIEDKWSGCGESRQNILKPSSEADVINITKPADFQSAGRIFVG